MDANPVKLWKGLLSVFSHRTSAVASASKAGGSYTASATAVQPARSESPPSTEGPQQQGTRVAGSFASTATTSTAPPVAAGRSQSARQFTISPAVVSQVFVTGRSEKWQQYAAKVEVHFPHLWRLACPRVYKNAGGYPSPRKLALDVAAILADHEFESTESRYRLMALAAASKLTQLRVPTFFVAPALLSAVQQTRPPLEVKWQEMQLPFHSAAFILPGGSLPHPTQGDACVLWYSRMTKAEAITVPGKRGTTLTADDDFFFIHATCLDSPLGREFQQSFAGRRNPALNLVDWDSLAGKPVSGPQTLPADDHNFIGSMVSLLFGLLFVMLARPQLVESGRATGKKKKHGLEIWSPNILGARYQILRAGNGNSGISPRMHWRRGHWRQQPFGPGRGLRRDLWIEPMLVAGDSVASLAS